MTVTVLTGEHGTFTFHSANSQTVDTGVLYVGDGCAVFAPGEWALAHTGEQVEK